MDQKNPRRSDFKVLSTEENIKLIEKINEVEKQKKKQRASGTYHPNGHRPAQPPKKKTPNYTGRVIAAIAIVCAVVILVSIIASAGSSCSKETTAVSTVSEQEPSVNKTSALEAVTEISEKPEHIDNKPKYNNAHEYKVNTKRLSAKTVKELDTEISAEFVALYDVTADEFIYLKNGTKKCYPASTTKILTAIVASQIITDPKTIITVGDEIKLIGEDSSTAYLEIGMKLSFEALIDALLLPSGNDAAYTIAVNCARVYKDDPSLSNEEAVKIFEELVNDAAKQIGADGTHFVTPDGWHDDDHYTSAVDLVKFGDYAKTIPLVAKSCGKDYAEWRIFKEEDPEESSETTSDSSTSSKADSQDSTASKSESSKSSNESRTSGSSSESTSSESTSSAGDRSSGSSSQSSKQDTDKFTPNYTLAWFNSNKLIRWDSGLYSEYCDGIKTGFTDQAGTSVVASATMDGHTFIVAVMNAQNLYTKYEDCHKMFTYAFELYGQKYTYG